MDLHGKSQHQNAIFFLQCMPLLNFICPVNFVCLFWLVSPPPSDTPFHQVDIASMQTVSIETLKRQDTFRQTGRLGDRKQDRIAQYCQLKKYNRPGHKGMWSMHFQMHQFQTLLKSTCLLMTQLFVSPNFAAVGNLACSRLGKTMEFAPFPQNCKAEEIILHKLLRAIAQD